MAPLAALACGPVFGIGLIVSGMFDPGKVLAFLDVAGAWDPSLAVVMGVAVPVAAVGYAIGRRRARPLLAPAFNAPPSRALDRRLVIGSTTFGVGWGLAGICPAPGVLLAATGHGAGIVFVLAMLAGMIAFDVIERMRAARASPSSAQS